MDVRFDSGSSWSYGFAPALEYSISPNVGVIFGGRVFAHGHNASSTVALSDGNQHRPLNQFRSKSSSALSRKLSAVPEKEANY